jgi:hypothetical protein
MRRILTIAVIIVIVGFVVIQFIPPGMIHWSLAREDRAVEQQLVWESEGTDALLRNACDDCHSNETRWPWYSNIAPVSWLVARDVNKGREAMNFSEDDTSDYNAEDMVWHMNNDMPPRIYLLLHPEAELTQEQKDQLAADFQAAFGENDHEGMDMDGMEME